VSTTDLQKEFKTEGVSGIDTGENRNRVEKIRQTNRGTAICQRRRVMPYEFKLPDASARAVPGDARSVRLPLRTE
jgi:hypothetical protein